MNSFGPINLVIIQATSFCNLDCDYCYLPDRQIRNQLSMDLDRADLPLDLYQPVRARRIRRRLARGRAAGCPDLVLSHGLRLIDEASKKYNHSQAQVVQSLQTNATLITQAWCDFFIEHHVEVGVSVDGPAFVHDAHG